MRKSHHRSDLTREQRKALKLIKRDGCAMREIEAGSESWWSLAGRRYNPRTLKSLLEKGKIAEGHDGLLDHASQTLVPT
jgi:hypothetical protein